MVKPFMIKVEPTKDGIHIELEVAHENGSSRRSQTVKAVEPGKEGMAIGSRVLWMLYDADEEGLL